MAERAGPAGGGRPAPARRPDLLPRIASAAVLAPAALALLYVGGLALDLLLVAVAGLMAWEWGRIASPGRHGAIVLAAVAAGAVGLAAWIALWPALALVGLAAAAVAAGLAGPRAPASLWAAAGCLVAPAPVIAFLALRAVPADGFALALWLLLVIWATDSFAYFVGRRLGGPRLAVRISPGKTWSGLLGGMLGAALVGAAAAAALDAPHPLRLAGAGAALAVVAQVGDLGISTLKRHFGVKDSGALIPGHGGVLDRVAGFILTAPIMAAVTAATGESVLAWL